MNFGFIKKMKMFIMIFVIFTAVLTSIYNLYIISLPYNNVLYEVKDKEIIFISNGIIPITHYFITLDDNSKIEVSLRVYSDVEKSDKIIIKKYIVKTK